MSTKPLFDWETGEPVEKASDLDYYVKDRCDDCGAVDHGWMLHAAGATGRCCPVLFLCNGCGGPQGPGVQS